MVCTAVKWNVAPAEATVTEQTTFDDLCTSLAYNQNCAYIYSLRLQTAMGYFTNLATYHFKLPPDGVIQNRYNTVATLAEKLN